MDGDTASKFVSSLVKSIQALCNGYIDFSSSIEVIGHIHLRIDQNQKFNYVLSEEVSKSKSEAATVFASHSYHSQPPPSITSGDGRSSSQTDSPNRHRRKSQQVPRVDESDSLTVSALPPDVPSVSKEKTSRRVSNSSDSPRTGTISDTDVARGVTKHENGSSVGKQVTSTQDSLDRRRKLQTESRPHDSAAKRSRTSGGSAANTGFEVIEIKEEPDDSSDYFGDDSAAGQDISQPDFSNLVAESLDRVGQMEGSSLLSGQHDQPFPVMLHANQSSSSAGLPGTSDQGAVASSSGEIVTYDEGAQVLPAHEYLEESDEEEYEVVEADDDDDSDFQAPLEIDVASLLSDTRHGRGRRQQEFGGHTIEIIRVGLPEGVTAISAAVSKSVGSKEAGNYNDNVDKGTETHKETDQVSPKRRGRPRKHPSAKEHVILPKMPRGRPPKGVRKGLYMPSEKEQIVLPKTLRGQPQEGIAQETTATVKSTSGSVHEDIQRHHYKQHRSEDLKEGVRLFKSGQPKRAVETKCKVPATTIQKGAHDSVNRKEPTRKMLRPPRESSPRDKLFEGMGYRYFPKGESVPLPRRAVVSETLNSPSGSGKVRVMYDVSFL